MRKRFEQQIAIGRILIKDVEIPTKKRSGSLPGLCAVLQKIYNRCPDKGYHHFKRYVGLGVFAYNLRKIGVELIRLTVIEEQRIKEKAPIAA